MALSGLRSLFGKQSEPGRDDVRPGAQRRRIELDGVPSPIYAIGDVHGRADLLEKLNAKIADDLPPGESRALIVMLGDYIDRGPDSRKVIENLISPPSPRLRRVCLAGNHEQMMLDFLTDPRQGEIWLENGGRATLASYGLAEEASGKNPRLRTLRTHALRAIPPLHLEFLQQLPVAVRFGRLVFVHAGLRTGLPLVDQRDEDMMWMRYTGKSRFARSDFLVVHGHTPQRAVLITGSRINVDTGAVFTGRLSAAKFVGGEIVDVLAT